MDTTAQTQDPFGDLLPRLASVIDHANRAGRIPPSRLTALSTVVPESVQWLWPGRIARGKLHILAGDPDLGKSFISLDVAARITTGRGWPAGGTPEVGNVIALSAEDDAADTVRPRFEAMGGDPYRLYVKPREGDGLTLQPNDVRELELLIKATGAVLVVMDPLNAYLGNVDSYKDADVRKILGPISEVAARTGAAILVVMHLTKNDGTADQPGPKAIYRVTGSIGFIGAARLALLVEEDRGLDAAPGTRLLKVIKSNLAERAPTLAYRIAEGPAGLPIVVWDGIRESASASNTRLEQDRQVLREILSKGAVFAKEGEKAAKAAGLTDRRLQEARKGLFEVCRIPGLAETTWVWRLLGQDSGPAEQPPQPLQAEQEAVGVAPDE